MRHWRAIKKVWTTYTKYNFNTCYTSVNYITRKKPSQLNYIYTTTERLTTRNKFIQFIKGLQSCGACDLWRMDELLQARKSRSKRAAVAVD